MRVDEMTRTPVSVLRPARMDGEEGECIVLIYSRGQNAMDLELIASEGESAWSTTIKEARLDDLKTRNSEMSSDAWHRILKAGLFIDEPSTPLLPELEGLEIGSTIAKEGHMSLVFRRSVGELTQRLGAIDLKPTDGEKFDLWSGCVAGAGLNSDARRHINELNRRFNEQIAKNELLQKQLDDLTDAKQKHDDALLTKFAELLNAKKAKIRQQQQILAIAKANPEKVEEVLATPAPTAGRQSIASKGSKRKVPATSGSTDDDDSSEGFESADDMEQVSENMRTPEERTEDDTTDDEDEDRPDAKPEVHGIKKTLQTRGKALDRHKRRSTSPKPDADEREPASTTTLARSREAANTSAVPPRRELPFGRRKETHPTKEGPTIGEETATAASQAKSTSSTLQSAADGADDDTTDDEL